MRFLPMSGASLFTDSHARPGCSQSFVVTRPCLQLTQFLRGYAEKCPFSLKIKRRCWRGPDFVAAQVSTILRPHLTKKATGNVTRMSLSENDLSSMSVQIPWIGYTLRDLCRLNTEIWDVDLGRQLLLMWLTAITIEAKLQRTNNRL